MKVTEDYQLSRAFDLILALNLINLKNNSINKFFKLIMLDEYRMGVGIFF